MSMVRSILLMFICMMVALTIVALILENDAQSVKEPLELPKISIKERALPNVDPDQVHCLALNVWHEARGTSYLDRLSVAHVTKNRVISKRYPNTICSVVFQGRHLLNKKTGKIYPIRDQCQFSWYCDGKSDKIKLTDNKGNVINRNVVLWNEIWRLSFEVLIGEKADPTNGATHYLNPRAVRNMPRWTAVYEFVHQTDGHHFYRMNEI